MPCGVRGGLGGVGMVRRMRGGGLNLEGKVVALDHGLSVVLMQGGRLCLLHLRLELRREHVLHPVDGAGDLIAQLQGTVLSQNWRGVFGVGVKNYGP